MTDLYPRAGPGPGLLPRQLTRLHEALLGLTGQARAALARTLADAAADLVAQAVRAALDAPDGGPAFDSWRHDPHVPPVRPTDPFDALYGYGPDEPEDRWYADQTPPPAAPRRAGGEAAEAWPAALALGLRAAAWWL